MNDALLIYVYPLLTLMRRILECYMLFQDTTPQSKQSDKWTVVFLLILVKLYHPIV